MGLKIKDTNYGGYYLDALHYVTPSNKGGLKGVSVQQGMPMQPIPDAPKYLQITPEFLNKMYATFRKRNRTVSYFRRKKEMKQL